MKASAGRFRRKKSSQVCAERLAKPVGFHRDAQAELADAATFYEESRRGIGSAFVLAVQEAAALISDYPEGGPIIAPGIRRWLVQRFPFALIYRVREEEIEVLAVMHTHRKPGYWRTRRK